MSYVITINSVWKIMTYMTTMLHVGSLQSLPLSVLVLH